MASSWVRLRGIALPVEHGGWGFWLEPMLLGLLVAFSPAGVCLGIASLGAFLLRQPLKIALIDRRKGKRYDRTLYAERFVLLYGAIALVFLVIAMTFAGPDILLPLLLVAPLALIQLAYDASSQSRQLLPELAGTVTLAAVAVSIALAGGWTFHAAFPLAVIIICRAVPSVLYVRARLLLEKGKSARVVFPVIMHGAAVVVLLMLAYAGAVPLLAVLMSAILLLRAVYGLSRFRRPLPAKYIGVQEVILGLMTVIVAAMGY